MPVDAAMAKAKSGDGRVAGAGCVDGSGALLHVGDSAFLVDHEGHPIREAHLFDKYAIGLADFAVFEVAQGSSSITALAELMLPIPVTIPSTPVCGLKKRSW